MTSDSATIVLLAMALVYMGSVGLLLHAPDDIRPYLVRLITGVCTAVGVILMI